MVKKMLSVDSESDEEDIFEEDSEDESEGEPPKPPRIPHRWRVTIMMALAFVLCNMDKVSCHFGSLLHSPLCNLGIQSSECQQTLIYIQHD